MSKLTRLYQECHNIFLMFAKCELFDVVRPFVLVIRHNGVIYSVSSDCIGYRMRLIKTRLIFRSIKIEL